MGDSIEYCQDCKTNVECHLNRGCLRLESSCPLGPMANWEAFGNLLARYGIIDSLAVEDPDGYDGFRTVGKIRAAYQEVSEHLTAMVEKMQSR